MAAPTNLYKWPKRSVLRDGDFESWTSGALDDWSASGAVTQETVDVYSGASSARLAPGAALWQPLVFYESAHGRWIDEYIPHEAFVYAKADGTPEDLGLKVKVMLKDGAGNYRYNWSPSQNRWVALADGATALDGEAWTFWLDSSWTRYRVPWIAPPRDASEEVADDWSFLMFVGNGGSATDVLVDSAHLGVQVDPKAIAVGRHIVLYNGYDYPVKYDVQTGVTTELSLHPPYWQKAGGSGKDTIPTTTPSNRSGYQLEGDKYYGFVFTSYNENTGEESAGFITVVPSSDESSAFTETPGAGNNAIFLDFANVEAPNQEAAKETDTTEITHWNVYRTVGYDTQEQAENALINSSVFFEARVALGSGAWFGAKSDEELIHSGASAPLVFPRVSRPMPLFDVATVWRNRLWVAGSREWRLGYTDMLGSKIAYGVDEGGTSAPTHWGRGVELYASFKRDVDPKPYPIVGYTYPKDFSTQPEAIWLMDTTPSAVVEPYRIRMRRGTIWASEEGVPYRAEGMDIFLEGPDSPRITALLPSGDVLLILTEDGVYTYTYDERLGDRGTVGTPIDRVYGCIAPGSAVTAGQDSYWLSRDGVVRYRDGRLDVISAPIRDILTNPDDPLYVERSRATRMPYFAEGVHNRKRGQYMLAVRTREGVAPGADKVLVWNYLLETWDIHHVEQGIVRWSVVMDEAGEEAILAHDGYGGIWRWGEGETDGVGEAWGAFKVRGRIVSATSASATLTDTGTLWTPAKSQFDTTPTYGLEGVFLTVRHPSGATEKRRIVRAGDKTVWLDRPWDVVPAAGSRWWLGNIEARLDLPQSDLGVPMSPKRLKWLAVDYEAENLGGHVRVETYAEDGDRTEASEHAIKEPRFRTSGDGRHHLAMGEAAGYVLRLRIRADGPENPFTLRGLSASFVVQESVP